MSELSDSLSLALPGSKDGSMPDWLCALRTRGSQQFRSLGLPSMRVEEWKYTSLRSLERRRPSLGLSNNGAETARAPQPLADIPLRVFMVDGDFSGIRGDLASGTRIMPLSTAIQEDGQEGGRRLKALLESLEIDQRGQGFSALNTATLNPGLLIHVGRAVNGGVLLVQWSGSERASEESLFNSRLCVVLEEGARFHLVEQFENGPGSASMLNVVVQSSLGPGAELSHTRVQEQSAKSILITRTDVSQSTGSRFHFTGLDLGEGMARHDVRAALLESGAVCSLNGACITAGRSHVDHHLEATHIAGECRSSQLFRAVANDRSRVVFNGKVHVGKGADGTEAQQSSKGLLLSPHAEIDTKPELEIYADEVIASHGASVGQLDEQALFYLRSRGLAKEAAKNLLTMAFCRCVADQLPVEMLRESLGERLSRSLAGNGAAHV